MKPRKCSVYTESQMKQLAYIGHLIWVGKGSESNFVGLVEDCCGRIKPVHIYLIRTDEEPEQ